jgi:FK506-binding protein 1
VIRGWDEGVLEMSLGEKAVLHITPDYGYGSEGAGGGVIPPNANLDFEVELLQVGDLKAPETSSSGCGGCIVQ